MHHIASYSFTVSIYTYATVCFSRDAQLVPQTQPHCWRYNYWTWVLASSGGSKRPASLLV